MSGVPFAFDGAVVLLDDGVRIASFNEGVVLSCWGTSEAHGTHVCGSDVCSFLQEFTRGVWFGGV